MTEISPLLHGRTPPKGFETRKFEKPWHRAAAYHFAQGMSTKEVAKANDVTPGCVTHLLKNEWFQELITAIMAESGKSAVEELLKGETMNSVIKLVEIRDDPTTPKAVAASVSDSILDRVYGKSQQRIKVDSEVKYADPVAEAERIEAESQRMKQKLGLAPPAAQQRMSGTDSGSN